MWRSYGRHSRHRADVIGDLDDGRQPGGDTPGIFERGAREQSVLSARVAEFVL
jgi:hypothetical protein